MTLSEIRRAAKVKKKNIPLDIRTINKIENGECNVRVCSLEKYLTAIGMRLTYSVQ